MTEILNDIANEFACAPFSDARLTNRLVEIAVSLAANPQQSIPNSCPNLASVKGTYGYAVNSA